MDIFTQGGTCGSFDAAQEKMKEQARMLWKEYWNEQTMIIQAKPEPYCPLCGG